MLTLVRLGAMYLSSIRKSEKGQGMVEYGLIIALIAVVVIVALTPLGKSVRDLFSGLIDHISPASEATGT